MEFVGEALKEYVLTEGVIEQPVVALGIATWGIVDNKEALISEDVRLLQKYKLNFPELFCFHCYDFVAA